MALNLSNNASEGKGKEELARKVKALEQQNEALKMTHLREVRQLSLTNAALEKEVQRLSDEIHALMVENRRLKVKLDDCYKYADDSDSDEVDHPSCEPLPCHQQPPLLSYPISSSASYLPASKPSKRSSKSNSKKGDDGAMGWGSLGLVGLGIAGAALGVSSLMSQKSSSSDDDEKSKKRGWF